MNKIIRLMSCCLIAIFSLISTVSSANPPRYNPNPPPRNDPNPPPRYNPRPPPPRNNPPPPPYYPPPSYYDVTCETFSNGYRFEYSGRNSSEARYEVTRDCRSRYYTNNYECDSNVVCNDDNYYRPMITCDTYSRGYRFSVQSRDEYAARQSVVNQCRSHSSTSNYDCDVNVYCR